MASFLGETIASVRTNLRSSDQHFVIDGGSTDGSVDVISRHQQDLAGWVSEPDRGYADALAKGFARARGDVLCWINCGDLLLAGALDAAQEALEDTGADMIFGDDFYIDEDSRVLFLSRGYSPDLGTAMLYAGWTPLQDACFWRRDLYERVGGIDPTLKYAADYDLFLRMALHGKTAYVPKAFSAFRRHAGQKSIAGASAYRDERERVRRRELAKEGNSVVARSARLAWNALAIRWRVRVMQHVWKRRDLEGRPIGELRCATYWPRS